MWDDLGRLAALPAWLRVLDEPEVVRAALVRSVPELRSGAFALRDVELERARNKKGTWSVHYRLSVGPAEGEITILPVDGVLHPPTTQSLDGISASGTFGAAGWRGVVPELGLVLAMGAPDVELSAFPALMDPGSARAILERGLREHARLTDIRIRSCAPKLLRYKAGSRCTILYGLDYAPESRDARLPDAVVVKTYSGYKGRNAWDGMRALWDSPLSESRAVAIAEPLAFIADLNVLVQRALPRDSSMQDLLQRALRSGSNVFMDELRARLRATARGLAALHACGVTYGEEVTWEDEVADVRDKAERIAGTSSPDGEAPEPMLRHLEELAAAYPPQTPLPCHRSFRPHQVLVSRGSVGFIDFDGFCRAEPALDVALFRSTLKGIGTRPQSEGDLSTPAALLERLAVLDGLCDVFTDEYAAVAPLSRERVALYETLDLLTNVVHCWIKVRPERLAGSMIALEKHVADKIRQLGG